HSGFGFSKSTIPMNISKHRQGISKYGSANENSFLRGAAISLQYKLLSFSVFYSHKNIDAHIVSADTADQNNKTIVSMPVSGLHRTLTEISYKKQVAETTSGYHIGLDTKNLQLGQTMCYNRLNYPSVTSAFQYNGTDSASKSNTFNAGIDYRFTWKNISVFGEGAIDKNFSFGILNGVLLNLNTQLSLSLLYRKYQRDYNAPFGTAFSESSTPVNEEGLYTGFVLHPLHHWKISGYFDSFQFPWLKFRADAPSHGYDYFLQAEFNPKTNTSMYWRFRREIKQVNNTLIESGISSLSNTILTKFRYNIKYSMSPQLSGANRIEMAWFNSEGLKTESGYLAYQDLRYSCTKFPAEIIGRFAVFETDGYYSRIYAYENDVLYAFSIPAFQDKGMRTYLLVKLSPLKSVDMWLRLSQTWYSNKNEIGSGPAAITGSSKSEVKVEMKVKL
ncbi:MAG TPA: hypothetical protein VE912_15890, partial [Bacteroidales bacterium]|nr:hypothetical protein [Bacteroidales bacterium]